MKKFVKILIMIVVLLVLFVCCSLPVEAETDAPTENTSTSDAEEANEGVPFTGAVWILGSFVLIVITLSFGLTKSASGSEATVHSLIDYIADNDMELKEKSKNVDQSLQKLIEKHPQIVETEEYAQLSKDLDVFRVFVENETRNKKRMTRACRGRYAPERGEGSSIGVRKIAGYRIIPFNTLDEYEKIKNKYSCPALENYDKDKNLVSFVVVDKKKNYVGTLHFSLFRTDDAVRILYDMPKNFPHKSLVRIVCDMSEYVAQYCGGIYFFVEMELDKKNALRMNMQHFYEKDGAGNLFYRDLIADEGGISLIRTYFEDFC